MKISLFWFNVYSVVTLAALLINLLLVIWNMPFVWIFIILMVQYEFVGFQVACILKKCALYKKKEIPELEFTKTQLVIKRLLKI